MNLQEYFAFIEECKTKDPNPFHIHHITPRYMGGDDSPENLIKLSYEDHYLAHIILADSFEIGSYHFNRNIWAALRLNKWVHDDTLVERLSLARKGKSYEELFGEETSNRAKEKLRKHWSEYWNVEENKERKRVFMREHNPMKNMKFTEDQLRKISDGVKNRWKNLSKEKLDSIRENTSAHFKKWWSEMEENKRNEFRERMSNLSKNWWKNTDSSIIKERNAKISRTKTGVPANPDSIKKLKETIAKKGLLKGENNPMFGKKHTEESKEKIRKKALGRSGPRLNKTFSSFKFFKNDEFIYEAHGQNDAKDFCKKENISFQVLCKKSNTWKNWCCDRYRKNNKLDE